MVTFVTTANDGFIIPGDNGTTPFSVADGDAALSVSFGPDAFGGVQAEVTYSFTQKYYPRSIAVDMVSGFFSSSFPSPILPMSGKWIIPISFRPGDLLALRAGFCGDDDDDPVQGTSGGPHIAMTIPNLVSKYTATGQILDGTAEESKSISKSTMTYAQLPLGLELKLGIKDSKGAYIAAKFDLSPATISGLANPTLYPTAAVLEYGRNAHSGQKTFRGVHIGTQTLTVTPDDTSIQPFTFTVGVFDPGALGNADVQYDQQIVNWGNRRGIPPHLLKGLIKKETGKFDPFTYRYEPLNKETGDLGISVALDELQDDPYEHYRMATPGGLAKGDLLLDLNAGTVYTTVDDVSARKTLKRQTGVALTPLDVCPASCVSAKELLLANDARQNWTKYAPWFDVHDPGDLASMNFTAQTPLAASYGLMQTMYQVAAELQWQTTDGRKNPSLLFDTLPNTLIGGGSLAVGTLEFYKRYRACRKGDWVTDPDFDDSAAYRSMMVDALNYYNHGSKHTNVTYGDDAWNFSQVYVPAHPLSKVFP
jgi:hypothetical protein